MYQGSISNAVNGKSRKKKKKKEKKRNISNIPSSTRRWNRSYPDKTTGKWIETGSIQDGDTKAGSIISDLYDVIYGRRQMHVPCVSIWNRYCITTDPVNMKAVNSVERA